MKFKAVKGTRDFYPEQMRLRSYIVDAWRRVSLRNGFEEYDSPIFEYLDLFTIKSGEEIAEQLFNFTDRGERNLAIRPEITPSLARMVNAKISTLPRPIKWFSVPRVCRAERPQKGRLREFFQWNIDIIGSDDVLADAECIYVAIDLLRELGLTPEDVVVRIGSRPLAVAAITSAGVAAEKVDEILPVLDKRAKLPEEKFVALCEEKGLSPEQIEAICRFQDADSIEAVRVALGDNNDQAITGPLSDLQQLLEHLEAMGVREFCQLDMHIVRGLAYYTGIVYEVFDRADSLRAVAGGGRYDNLLEVLGGPAIGATGFGMGDVVLGILLEEKDKVPSLEQAIDFFVIDDEEDCLEPVLRVVAGLRRLGWTAAYSFKRQKTPKQLKEAVRSGAAAAVFVSRDQSGLAGHRLRLKNLRTGKQHSNNFLVREFLERPELSTVRDIDTLLERFGLDEE
jgi:histidyl-tRNA synthetase